MKIYTRSGDGGETSLYSKQRVLKNHPIIEAVGTIDECNSAIGTAIAHLPDQSNLEPYRNQLLTIQHALFDLGAALATPRTSSSSKQIEKTRFDQEEIDQLEIWIDEMDKNLPKLTTFILPGGHPAGANLHLSRSICRRAERNLITINQQADVSDKIMTYINRLSDYLFVVSRQINQLLHSPETKWKPHLLKSLE
ncbi:MAG: cob(I)yrinic acid a,c-diamide adenosyltransferase [Waddliaceae bacterium]